MSLAVVSALVAGISIIAGPPASDAATRRLVSGWIPYWATAAGVASFNANADLFADVSPFWHSLTSDTTVSDQATAANRAAVQDAARAKGVPVVAAVTDGTGKGKLAAALASPARRATVVQTLVNLTVSRGYNGLDLDLEGFAYSDGRATWASTRPNWVAFVKQLGAALHARGKVLHATIPPTYDSNRGNASGYWVYDYAGIAPHVDRVRIMAYDYSVGSPGPIAPYSWVQRIVTYAKTQVPAGKLVLGIPSYGRDWPTSISGTCPAGTETARRSLTSKAAWQVAAQKGAAVRWDAAARERTFTYSDRFADATTSCTVARTVWFSDAAAISDRTKLAYGSRFASVALWTVGGEDAQTWGGLRSIANGLGYPLFGGQTLEVKVAGGTTGVPADAKAVALNVTVTSPSGPGYLRVFPCGSAMPTTSTVNYVARQTVANAVQVGVGFEGKVCVYTSNTAHVVVDASGYYPAGSPFEPQSPQRLVDTRSGGKPTAGRDVAVTVPSGTKAAALTVTVTEPSTPGWVSAYPCGTKFPGTSTVNFSAGQTIAGGAIVRPGGDGRVCIRTSTATHVVVDLTGVFRNGAGFAPTAPSRLADTRISPGTPVRDGAQLAVTPRVAGSAAVLNVTATGPRTGGWIQTFPCGTAPPSTSTVNYTAGQTISNLAIGKVGANGKVCLRTSVDSHIVVDQTAAFGPGLSYFAPISPARMVDTRLP